MHAFIYAAACVLVPILWGVGVALAINRVDGRRAKPASDSTQPPPGPEYHI